VLGKVKLYSLKRKDINNQEKWKAISGAGKLAVKQIYVTCMCVRWFRGKYINNMTEKNFLPLVENVV